MISHTQYEIEQAAKAIWDATSTGKVPFPTEKSIGRALFIQAARAALGTVEFHKVRAERMHRRAQRAEAKLRKIEALAVHGTDPNKRLRTRQLMGPMFLHMIRRLISK